jgi:hypothetical protein
MGGINPDSSVSVTGNTPTKYATYICEHKAKFGTWPMVNLSNTVYKGSFTRGSQGDGCPELHESY